MKRRIRKVREGGSVGEREYRREEGEVCERE